MSCGCHLLFNDWLYNSVLTLFPRPGTYAISTPIKQQYFTQLVGDAVNPPTIKGLPSFAGMALLDADPYDPAYNWFTNQ